MVQSIKDFLPVAVGGGAGPIEDWAFTPALAALLPNIAGTTAGTTAAAAAGRYTLTPDANIAELAPGSSVYASIVKSDGEVYANATEYMDYIVPTYDVSDNVGFALGGLMESGATFLNVFNQLSGNGVAGDFSYMLQQSTATGSLSLIFCENGALTQTNLGVSVVAGDRIQLGLNKTTGELSLKINAAAATVIHTLSVAARAIAYTPFFGLMATGGAITFLAGSLDFTFNTTSNSLQGMQTLGAPALPAEAADGKRYRITTTGGPLFGKTVQQNDIIELTTNTTDIVITRLLDIDPTSFQTKTDAKGHALKTVLFTRDQTVVGPDVAYTFGAAHIRARNLIDNEGYERVTILIDYDSFNGYYITADSSATLYDLTGINFKALRPVGNSLLSNNKWMRFNANSIFRYGELVEENANPDWSLVIDLSGLRLRESVPMLQYHDGGSAIQPVSTIVYTDADTYIDGNSAYNGDFTSVNGNNPSRVYIVNRGGHLSGGSTINALFYGVALNVSLIHVEGQLNRNWANGISNSGYANIVTDSPSTNVFEVVDCVGNIDKAAVLALGLASSYVDNHSMASKADLTGLETKLTGQGLKTFHAPVVVGSATAFTANPEAICAMRANHIAATNVTDGTLEMYKYNYSTGQYDLLGTPVAITGLTDETAICAMTEDSLAMVGHNGGSIRQYVFNYTTNTWSSPGTEATGVFPTGAGYSVCALKSDTIAILVAGIDDLETWYYNVDTSAWSQVGNTANPTGVGNSKKMTALSETDVVIWGTNSPYGIERWRWSGISWSLLGTVAVAAYTSAHAAVAAVSPNEVAILYTNDAAGKLCIWRFTSDTEAEQVSPEHSFGAPMTLPYDITAANGTDIVVSNSVTNELNVIRFNYVRELGPHGPWNPNWV